MAMRLDFYDKEIPKMDSYHTSLAVISLDSALKKDEKYYSQVFLLFASVFRAHVIKEYKLIFFSVASRSHFA